MKDLQPLPLDTRARAPASGPVPSPDAADECDNSELLEMLAPAGNMAATGDAGASSILDPLHDAAASAMDTIRSAGADAQDRARAGWEEAIRGLGLEDASEIADPPELSGADSSERSTEQPSAGPDLDAEGSRDGADAAGPASTVGADHLAWQAAEVGAVLDARVEDAKEGVTAQVEAAEDLVTTPAGAASAGQGLSGGSAALVVQGVATQIAEGGDEVGESLQLAGEGSSDLTQDSSKLIADAQQDTGEENEEEGFFSELWAGARSGLEYAAGAGMQFLSDELGGALDGWLDGFASDSFHHGRGLGDAAAFVLGAAETALGLLEIGGAFTITGGGAAVAAGSGGLLALPAAGVVVVVDALALTTGLALAGHGGLVMMAASNGARNGRGDTGPKPAPETPKGFPDAKAVRRKTSVQGGGGLRKRWVDGEGNILEWDSRHGAIEKYDGRGRHLGEFDPETGAQTKPPDRTRRVEP